MSVWKFYDNKKGEIEKRYPELCSLCEGVLENLWLIYEKLNKELNDYAREHGELPPVEQFNLIFFMRSIPYLISAFILAEQGLVNPSRNIMRTVYEQILRSHLFLKNPKDADLWYEYWEKSDKKVEKKMRRKLWLGHSYMIDSLYKGEKREQVKAFYKVICRYAHPSIVSLWSDYDNLGEVEDSLRGVLGMTYETIKLLQKTFPKYISGELHQMCDDTKNLIGKYLGDVFDFDPNN